MRPVQPGGPHAEGVGEGSFRGKGGQAVARLGAATGVARGTLYVIDEHAPLALSPH